MYWFPFNISFITFIINCIPFLYRKSLLYISFVWSFFSVPLIWIRVCVSYFFTSNLIICFIFLYFESWVSVQRSFTSNPNVCFMFLLLRIPLYASYSFILNLSICFMFLYFESQCVLHIPLLRIPLCASRSILLSKPYSFTLSPSPQPASPHLAPLTLK